MYKKLLMVVQAKAPIYSNNFQPLRTFYYNTLVVSLSIHEDMRAGIESNKIIGLPRKYSSEKGKLKTI